MAKIKIANIDLDVSIQCRAAIDTATVNEYAERMTEGDKFPPVVLFGTAERCWIGDGWHRVMAARQIDARDIDSDLRSGGRLQALTHALNANAIHGRNRTNDDKRRCVEIALREFPKLTSPVIADMCGVGHDLVESMRPRQSAENADSKRTGRDGKQYPPKKKAKKQPTPKQDTPKEETNERPEPKAARPVSGPPRYGMQMAKLAVMRLEEIREDDAERDLAFAFVRRWLDAHSS